VWVEWEKIQDKNEQRVRRVSIEKEECRGDVHEEDDEEMCAYVASLL
jgi:hypothetical protein